MFTPKKINLNEINGGARYVDGNEVSPEAINAPIEASAYAQEKAEEAITKADIAMEKVNDSEIGEITLSAYPVGSIYMSINSTSPAELFGGGTWEKIEGRFLMGSGTPTINSTNKYGSMNGAGYSFAVGEMGGQFKHTLTVEEMPSHNHQLCRPRWYTTDGKDRYTAFGGTTEVNEAFDNFAVRSTGGGQMHNVLNPYYTVNMWKRIA